MSHWSDDPQFWDRLDDFCKAAGIPFRDLAQTLFKYDSQMDANISAMLFGGVGEFLKAYSTSRFQGLEAMESFKEGMKAVHNNPRMKRMFEGMTVQAVDGKVTDMKGGEF